MRKIGATMPSTGGIPLRQARDRALLLMRRWLTRRLDNFVLESELTFLSAQTTDLTISLIADLLYYSYSDVKHHRFPGWRSLDKATRRGIACWMLFLRTDIEYQWPHYSGSPLPVAAWCSPQSTPLYSQQLESWPLLGRLIRAANLRIRKKNAQRAQEVAAFRSAGEVQYWPFISRKQLHEAEALHYFLGGSRPNPSHNSM